MQEEVLSANKNILICRDTTERPETIESGFGKLIGTEINKNKDFLEKKILILTTLWKKCFS